MYGNITLETKEKMGSVFTFTVKGNKIKADLAKFKQNDSVYTENAGVSICEEIPMQKLRFRRLGYKPKSSLDSISKEACNNNSIPLIRKKSSSRLTKYDTRNIMTQNSMQKSCPNLFLEESKCNCKRY
jgi:hypothetical protein